MAAAIELLAEHGPTEVSGRQLAARAKVNYGLVHHYFGSKENVFRDALAARGQDLVERLNASSEPRLPAAFAGDTTAWLAWIQVAREWDRYESVFVDHPIMRHAVEVLAGRSGGTVTPEIKARVAASTALQMGWVSMRSYLLSSVQAHPSEEAAIEQKLREIADSITDL
jgi:AcrR family transcriptional regulator